MCIEWTEDPIKFAAVSVCNLRFRRGRAVFRQKAESEAYQNSRVKIISTHELTIDLTDQCVLSFHII